MQGGAPGIAWTTAVVAFVLALPLWRISNYAITVAHEGGHALIGLLFGGKFAKKAIVLNRSGGGTTTMAIGGIGRILMLLAGYLGPSAVGFSGAEMLVHGFSPRTVLVIDLVFAIFVLVLTRNAFGLLVSAGTVVVLWIAAVRAAPDAQLFCAYVWVWFMLMGSTRVIPHLYRGVLRQQGDQDPELLQKHAHRRRGVALRLLAGHAGRAGLRRCAVAAPPDLSAVRAGCCRASSGARSPAWSAAYAGHGSPAPGSAPGR